MTVLRIPAFCWYRGTPRRARTERNVAAWTAVPLEIPDVRSSDLSGRIRVRDEDGGTVRDMVVLGGMAMTAMGTWPASEDGLDARGFEARTDAARADATRSIHPFALFTNAPVLEADHEDDVVAQMKEVAWSTRDDAIETARTVASRMAVIDGVVHTALEEPLHVFDPSTGGRKTSWARLASWNDGRDGRIVARVDRIATDGGPFGDGIEIEGDAEEVRWTFRDADANALQIARFFFSDDRLTDLAASQGRLGRMRECASGIASGRSDAAAAMLSTFEEVLATLPGTVLGSAPPVHEIAGDHARLLLRLARSIRHAHDADDRLRPAYG